MSSSRTILDSLLLLFTKEMGLTAKRNTFAIQFTGDEKKNDIDVEVVADINEEIICNQAIWLAGTATYTVNQALNQSQRLGKIKQKIQGDIKVLEAEILPLSSFLSGFFNREIIAAKSSELSALKALLAENTFSDMSIVASIEKDNLNIAGSNSLTEQTLNCLSEAEDVDDFFVAETRLLHR